MTDEPESSQYTRTNVTARELVLAALSSWDCWFPAILAVMFAVAAVTYSSKTDVRLILAAIAAVAGYESLAQSLKAVDRRRQERASQNARSHDDDRP